MDDEEIKRMISEGSGGKPAPPLRPDHPEHSTNSKGPGTFEYDDDEDVYNDWTPVAIAEDPKAAIMSFVTEAQIAVITGEIPDEAIQTRPITSEKGEHFCYISHWTVTKILNAAFLGNWEQVIEGREVIQNPVGKKWECRVWGHLRVTGANGLVRRIWFDSSDRIKDSGNTTIGKTYESAMSRGLTKAAMRLGIGLKLADDRFKERILVQRGQQKKPLAYDHNELKKALGAERKDDVLPALREMGLDVEDWEMHSKKMMLKLLAEVKWRKQ